MHVLLLHIFNSKDDGRANEVLISSNCWPKLLGSKGISREKPNSDVGRFSLYLASPDTSNGTVNYERWLEYAIVTRGNVDCMLGINDSQAITVG